MSPDAFVSQHAAALTAGDLDAIADLYTDGAQLVSFEWTADGRDAVRNRFERFLDFHGEIQSVDVEQQRTTDADAFVLYAVTGKRGTFRIVNVFVLDGDRCAKHFSNETDVELDRDEVERELD